MTKVKLDTGATAAVSAIASAISEGFKLLSKAMSGSEKRRMRRCIEIGEKIVLRLDELNIDDKELVKLSKAFWKYNN